MKRLIVACLIVGAAIGITGCASDSGGAKDKPAPKPEAKDNRKPEEKLSVGMTRDDVKKALGDPADKSVNSNGEESWQYRDTAKAFIPFYSLTGGKFQFLTVNFDKDGKVKNWSSTEHGAY